MATRHETIVWALGTATSRDATFAAPVFPSAVKDSRTGRQTVGSGAVHKSTAWRSRTDASLRDWVASRLAERRATAGFATDHPVSVSLAHSAGHAIAGAASHPARIGVDLERQGSIDAAHIRYFLVPREQEQLGRLSVTDLWTLKEAAWKALGLDDTIPFTRLELLFDADGAPYAARYGSMIEPIAAQLREPWPGWVAAVVLLAGTAA